MSNAELREALDWALTMIEQNDKTLQLNDDEAKALKDYRTGLTGGNDER